MATIELPAAPAETLSIRYLEPNPRHERAYSSVEVRIADGAIESHVRYADKSFGDRFMASIFPLHSGRYFGMAGVIVFMMASLAMPLFAITGWMLYLARRRRKKRGHAHVPGDAGLAADPACVGIALETDT
jgi:sulfite reductase (NADPH) flavoprotein alpha-component